MSKDIPDKVEIEETSKANSKRKRTFEAWNHFKRVKVEGIQFAERNYCKARLKAPSGYDTTHLYKHYDKVCICSSFSHTAEVLVDTLFDALMNWNIDCKVSTIMVDNCTTNDAMINHLLQKLPTKEMLLDEKNCYDLLLDYQSRCCTLNESSSSIGGLENTMPSDVHSNVNMDESLDEFDSKTSDATNLSVMSELDMYLEESLLPRTRDFDILNWWKINGVKFSTLQKMARDI
ncbi:UNVERIFIED_CONTAM: Zinc finger BED domain-containing protein RICESLEEPER 2 [Sesamum calycinum]|uniref:Zinc finger BED domain-containing protein RICESLEEPER 2 n=1 Tax=Sesamum calycinum TaxID=2727403 RepID=A0AAW2MQM2_9LAMI